MGHDCIQLPSFSMHHPAPRIHDGNEASECCPIDVPEPAAGLMRRNKASGMRVAVLLKPYRVTEMFGGSVPC